LQVASRALEAPIENIHMSETSTSTIANNSTTGGSSGSDICGAAVLVCLVAWFDVELDCHSVALNDYTVNYALRVHRAELLDERFHCYQVNVESSM
jgi:xanthine dehydrogenase molybdopterin-binding subunit B